jgi:glutamate--cysteine ligase
MHAGWHARSKARHFEYTLELITEFARMVRLDPWLFSCLHARVDAVNINTENDRRRLYEEAVKLFNAVKVKYEEHKITDKPFVFLKSDSGTYGMGVIPIESPEEILNLNRSGRNKLNKGKGGQLNERFLLQEGVPTITAVDQHVSEAVIYQIDNNLVGGFYRFNSAKNSRDNLNSPGMEFKKMCPHLPKYGNCGVHHDMNIFDVYRILARIAGIAAHREIMELEKKNINSKP